MVTVPLGLCEARKLEMALAKMPEGWKGYCLIKKRLDS